MYELLGDELIEKEVDSLLGPGINIKRDPRCGRNFEYFSEDPLLAGRMAAVMTKAVQKSGATLTAKHFACNNCELCVEDNPNYPNTHFMASIRGYADSIVSERALREIYLKVFEIYVKEGGARSIMTAYNPVNGCYAASNYDLNTTILREEWGFDGIVMTDWWANMSEKPWANGNMSRDDQRRGTMIKAQNDVWMTIDGDNSYKENGEQNSRNRINRILEDYRNGYLTLGELQRSAVNTCNYLMKSQAFATMNRLDVQDVADRFYTCGDEWFTAKSVKMGKPQLEKITVGGRILKAFKEDTYRYKVYLPADEEDMPEVAVTPKAGTTVEVHDATSENRVAVIKATEGLEVVRYYISFTDEDGMTPVLENPIEAKLSEITIDGKPIEGFKPDVYEYSVAVDSLYDKPDVSYQAPDGVAVTEIYEEETGVLTLKAVSADQALSYRIRMGVMPHSDEFEEEELADFWDVDERSDANLSLNEGCLVIRGERGGVWQGENDLKNRVYQSAYGDWDAVVKIDVSKMPDKSYQSLGVMVLEDYNNFIYVKMESGGGNYNIALAQEKMEETAH